MVGSRSKQGKMARASSGSDNNHAPAPANQEPPRELSKQDLIQEVKRRPVIWNTTIAVDPHRVATAWRKICQLTWPEFDHRPPDVKRTLCLQLQKDWRDLKESFIKEYCRRQENPGQLDQFSEAPKHYDFLTFLTPTITKDKKCELNEDELRPTKRQRTDHRCTCDCSKDEDQKFLLSLVSHMQDVPKASKLALRSEILQVISKYTTSKPL